MTSEKKPLHKIVAEHLRDNPGQYWTPQELGRFLAESHYDFFSQKAAGLKGRTSLANQLAKEVYAQKGQIASKHSDIQIDASKRPIRLVSNSTHLNVPLTDTKPIPASQNVTSPDDKQDVSEHGIYGTLQDYLWSERGIVSKRIRESTSNNRRGRNGNKWLHPDIVGMSAPGEEWTDVVRECAMLMPTRKAQLVSIEVKLRLSAGDIRESFFQAVSNSLWANQAYLAALEVRGEDTLRELQMLCSLHGVGYIAIDKENFTESRVLIPPREREEVDWASANRIADENGDFSEYLANVLNYLKTGKVQHKLWDRQTS